MSGFSQKLDEALGVYRDESEILQHLAEIVSKNILDSHKIGQIRALLFNSGLREFGKVGDQVEFDTTHHEINQGSPLPGDVVVISVPGWEDQGGVLVKAQIKT